MQVFKIEKSCAIILAGGVPVVALIAGLLYVPESPRWLVSLLAMLLFCMSRYLTLETGYLVLIWLFRSVTFWEFELEWLLILLSLNQRTQEVSIRVA